MKVASILFFFLIQLRVGFVFAQGSDPSFGRSTKQYTIHNWQFISSDNFDAYFYGDGHHLAEVALIIAEQELKKIEDIIDYRIGTRSQIILYQSEYDLRHSNLFQKQVPFNPGAYTYVIQNKIISAFNGSRADLKKSIRYGIGDLLVNELMYGGSFQERIRSSTLLYMPEWFYKGLLSYISEPWSTTMDDKIRDGFLSNKFDRINLLSPQDAELAGHSWWNYIAQTYGVRSISDILYLTRVSRGYENALNFVLGTNSRHLFKDWKNFYTIRYSSDPGTDIIKNSFPLPSNLNSREIVQMKLAPKGNQLLLSAHLQGRMELWLVTLSDKKSKRIYTSDDRTPFHWHEMEPVICWNSKGTEINVFLHEKGKLQHLVLKTNGKVLRRTPIDDLSLVRSASAHPEEALIVLSGVKNGQSDLYTLTQEGLKNLTSDAFDDHDPVFSADGKHIYFSSNRQQESQRFSQDYRFSPNDSSSSDIYSMAYPSNDTKLIRVTSSPYIHEVQPKPYSRNGVAYLSDNNGIFNTYVTLGSQSLVKTWVLVNKKGSSELLDSFVIHGELDTQNFSLEDLELDSTLLQNAGTYRFEPVYKQVFRHYPLSNHSRNILLFDTDLQLEKEAALVRHGKNYYIQLLDISDEVENDAQHTDVIPTAYRQMTGYLAFISDSNSTSYLIERQDKPIEEAIVVAKSDTLPKQLPYTFQTGFPDLPNKGTKKKSNKEKEINYRIQPHPYKRSFFPSYLVSQLIDNSIINTPYYINNEFSSIFNTYSRPNLNARVELSINDLFNDHSILAGGRIPVRLYSSDFYIHYIQRKYKRDFGVSFFRTSRLIDGTTRSNRVFIHEVRPFVIQPLKSNFELVLSPFYRTDRSVQNATDQGTLLAVDEINQWVGAKIELVYDRHLMEDVNFPVGVKAKAYVEHFQNLSNQANSTSILGFDARWYKKLHAKVLWANRISATSSFGPSSVNYILGGTENWLSNTYNEQLGTNTGYQYIFSSLSNGVRGFQQNMRNGGKSFILNSEIRIPVSSYVSRIPVNMGFLRTLQWVAFYDIGSAWNGWNPFADQHYNTRIVDQGSVRISVRNRNNPFISGFGTGLRTRIFGYYLRTDIAWGIENGVISNEGQALWHFSLGYDF